MTKDAGASVGPLLFARGGTAERVDLSALYVAAAGAAAPSLLPDGSAAVEPALLATCFGRNVWRYDFALPAQEAACYRFGAETHRVATDLGEQVRIAYLSCNGQEQGDLAQQDRQRNAMWRRLTVEHAARPFNLLLHGGDQLYADEVLAADPALAQWAAASRRRKAIMAFSPAMASAAERFYFERYLELYSQPEFAAIAASVPSAMMWDDHDIFDGWGSFSGAVIDSPVGRGIFRIAQRMFALFQRGGVTYQDGGSLSYRLNFPGFAVIAPDLRSERRPKRVLGDAGWRALESMLAEDQRRALLLSSVPALGPRLSWLELAMDLLPGLQKYQDDLRDQWQSRAHRAEWRRFLRLLESVSGKAGTPILLSGEIHLATRGEMTMPHGTLHQLVASGIVHPPPPHAYAKALSLLARLGEAPLEDRPIRLHPVPGQQQIYRAERNYLVLQRRNQQWSAEWELENSGRSPPLAL